MHSQAKARHALSTLTMLQRPRRTATSRLQLFLETAGNEREHAKLWFKYLHGGEILTP